MHSQPIQVPPYVTYSVDLQPPHVENSGFPVEVNTKGLTYRRFFSISCGILGIALILIAQSLTLYSMSFNKIPDLFLKYGASEHLHRYKIIMAATGLVMAAATAMSFSAFIFLATNGVIARVWTMIDKKYLPNRNIIIKTSLYYACWIVALIALAQLGIRIASVGEFSWDGTSLVVLFNATSGALYCYLIKKKVNRYNIVLLTTLYDFVASGLFQAYNVRKCRTEFAAINSFPLHKEAVMGLLEKSGMPKKDVFHGSIFNAFYTSDLFGNEVIVLGTPLFEAIKSTKEQILAVVSHELGHRHYKDVYSLSISSLVKSIIEWSIRHLLVFQNPYIFAMFGFQDVSAAGALVIADMVMFPIKELLNPINMSIGQFLEYRADRHAVNLGHGEGSISFQVAISSFALPDAPFIFEKTYLTHPTGLNRAIAIYDLMHKSKDNKS